MPQWKVTTSHGRKFRVEAPTDLAARVFAERKGIIVASVTPLSEAEENDHVELAPGNGAARGGSAIDGPRGAHASAERRGPEPGLLGGPTQLDMLETLRAIDARLATLSETIERGRWHDNRRAYFRTTRDAVFWGIVFAWLAGVGLCVVIWLVILTLGLLGVIAAESV